MPKPQLELSQMSLAELTRLCDDHLVSYFEQHGEVDETRHFQKARDIHRAICLAMIREKGQCWVGAIYRPKATRSNPMFVRIDENEEAWPTNMKFCLPRPDAGVAMLIAACEIHPKATERQARKRIERITKRIKNAGGVVLN